MGVKEPLEDDSISHSICSHCEEESLPSDSMRWYCNDCPQTFPNYKELIEHYGQYHGITLKRFQIRHKGTGYKGIVPATSASEACAFFGWQAEDCTVRVIN